MSLTPEEIAELTDEVSLWFTQDIDNERKYIAFGFYTLYLYHYLTTLGEEVSIIWPQKWRTGAILFILLRYLPICYIILAILMELRIHMDLTPKVSYFACGPHLPVLTPGYSSGKTGTWSRPHCKYDPYQHTHTQ
ncbi:hypothetical protein DFP72DRAFT_1091777 [Ephemerocybe angulata]|uniref:DUF6533 domain-containing protein n=1 Tax=Ephemerocybe angulata TaxID=980116 RepID=A0A8H6HG71_9AGAR|nr:hypothetical protein DFP72DRAFT_1091777 [Tulosesus angulatus]